MNGCWILSNAFSVSNKMIMYIRKEYTEVSELDKNNKQPPVTVQPTAAETPAQGAQEGQEGAGNGEGGEIDGKGGNGATNGTEGQKEGV